MDHGQRERGGGVGGAGVIDLRRVRTADPAQILDGDSVLPHMGGFEFPAINADHLIHLFRVVLDVGKLLVFVRDLQLVEQSMHAAVAVQVSILVSQPKLDGDLFANPIGIFLRVKPRR